MGRGPVGAPKKFAQGSGSFFSRTVEEKRWQERYFPVVLRSCGLFRISIRPATRHDGYFTVTIAEPDLEENAKLAAALETWKQLLRERRVLSTRS